MERRDIIHEYSNFGSQTYAPLTRIGMFLDRGSEQYVVKSRHLSTYQGLLELEASLPDFVVNPRVKAPKPKTVTKTGYMKRKYRQEQELKDMHTVRLALLKTTTVLFIILNFKTSTYPQLFYTIVLLYEILISLTFKFHFFNTQNKLFCLSDTN